MKETAAAVATLRVERPTSHPVDIGLRTEAVITARLLAAGHTLLQPCGFNHPYDLVLETAGAFLRAQIKTGRLRAGAVQFHTASVRCNTRSAVIRGYEQDVDLFLVYCAATDGIYAVPIEEAAKGNMRLRVSPAENRQVAGVRWAADYLLPA